MNFNQVKQKLQQVYTQRGGSAAAKADGTELRNIFKGDGSLADKAKAAVQALRVPGAAAEPTVDQHPDESNGPPSTPGGSKPLDDPGLPPRDVP